MQPDRISRMHPSSGAQRDSTPPAYGLAGAADRRSPRVASVSPIPLGATPVRTVLVAVDGTSFGEYALPFAVEVARRAGAALRVVHVFSSWEVAGEASQLAAGAQWVLDQQRRRSEYLDGLIQRLKQVHPLPVTGALLDGADVAEAVCKASASADLVVMATRNRGAWARFWRGSVTAAVARRARCPVLLVHGREDPPDLTVARLLHDFPPSLDGGEQGEGAVRAAAASSYSRSVRLRSPARCGSSCTCKTP